MDITRVACEQREEQRRERDAAEVEQRRRDDARGNIAARKAARGGRRLHGRGQYAEEEETERERRRQQRRGGRLRGEPEQRHAAETKDERAALQLPIADAVEHFFPRQAHAVRSEEHTSELQSLMRISYAAFCLRKKKI